MANKYELRRRALKEARGRDNNPFAAPSSYTPPPRMDRRGLTLALSLGLVALITALYVQTAVRGILLPRSQRHISVQKGIYEPIVGHDFTVCDDNVYIYGEERPQVKGGLTQPLAELKDYFLHGKPKTFAELRGNAIVWAFADAHEGNWHPLTWLSHMLDWELFSGGSWEAENLRYKYSWAGGHHLVSMGIHCLNAVLLFLALRLMTGTLWPSFVVAALFGIHPLRVESVAWAAERKDVLCGLFWIASMLAYAWYARRRPTGASFAVAIGIAGIMTIIIIVSLHALLFLDLEIKTSLSVLALMIGLVIAGMLIDGSLGSDSRGTRLAKIGSYLLITLFLALGLMSKSMIVTLPCVFMLLDIWPLRRWQRALWPSGRGGAGPDLAAMLWLVVEKIPWIAMVMGDAYITVYGQNKGVALSNWESFPLDARLWNAVVSCGEYLRQSLWPTGLAPFYVHPQVIPDGWTTEIYVKFYLYCACSRRLRCPRSGFAGGGLFWPSDGSGIWVRSCPLSASSRWARRPGPTAIPICR